jgi:hypothetical protein
MKKLTLIFTLLVSTVMFSSPSYAEWTKVDTNVKGDTFYVDFERTRKVDGYVYYWSLGDYLKPKNGVLSFKNYRQGDCKLFRFKYLSFVYHKQPMGRDIGETTNLKNPEWNYPTPKSVGETILKSVCSR